jgi:hypothetical protein
MNPKRKKIIMEPKKKKWCSGRCHSTPEVSRKIRNPRPAWAVL